MTQLRDFNLLLGDWKANQEPSIAKNADFTPKKLAFLVNQRPWERPFLCLTFPTKVKAAKLAGCGLPFFYGGLAIMAVWVITLLRRTRTGKIENWRVLFDYEFPIPDVEMSKLKFQVFDFLLLPWNQIQLELNWVVGVKTWAWRNPFGILVNFVYCSVLRTVVWLVKRVFRFFGFLTGIPAAIKCISLSKPLSFYLNWVHFYIFIKILKFN